MEKEREAGLGGGGVGEKLGEDVGVAWGVVNNLEDEFLLFSSE